MPVRSIPRSYRSITGRLAPVGIAQSIEHESLLERDCALLFQADPAVLSVEGQPVQIVYLAANKKGRIRSCHYTPDFLVRFHRHAARPPLLVEVKYEEELRAKRNEYLPKIRAASQYARERGWHYRIYTDRRIRGANSRLRNLKFLRSYLREERDNIAAESLLSILAVIGAAQVKTLLERCSNADREQRGRFVACLWRLVATHEVHADLDTPLTLETLIHAAASARGAAILTRPTLR